MAEKHSQTPIPHAGAIGAGLPDPAARACSTPGCCPICARPNGCRLETGGAFKGPCWCEALEVSAEALERLLGDLPESRCLCRDCLAAIAATPEIPWEELAAKAPGGTSRA